MKLTMKTTLPLTLTIMILSSASIASMISSDPFIKEWLYFDGVNTYKLNITKSSAPGQDYHIDYTFPGGNASTDMCTATSSLSFNCLPGETVTRDDNRYSVTLVSRFNTTTYYDPQHMPPLSTIFGNWSMHKRDTNYHISIMRGPSDNEYNVMTSFSDSRGNHCYHGIPDVYKVTKNPDGTETISRDSGFTKYRFKYDSRKNQISNINSSREFFVGQCVELYDDNNSIFTKD